MKEMLWDKMECNQRRNCFETGNTAKLWFMTPDRRAMPFPVTVREPRPRESDLDLRVRSTSVRSIKNIYLINP